MWQTFLDLLFPRRSLTGVAGEWITEEERRHLASHPVTEDAAVLRKRGIRYLDRLTAASTYAECPLLKKAIRTFKYGRVRELDCELGRLIARVMPDQGEHPPVLCPVPLHWMRKFQRGFNQAERLARVVAREKGMSVALLLKRIRPTGAQAKRARAERLTAVAGAFRWSGGSPPQRVILIDDLSTTGATLNACAQALKDAGVSHVEAWVVAHDSLVRDKSKSN